MGIKPNEVRSGNIFRSTGRGYVTLKEVKIDSNGNGIYTFNGNDNVEGIVNAVPLAKENVKHFGFHESEENYFEHDDSDLALEWLDTPPMFVDTVTRTELKEVHQLQNHFFFLNNRELEIKVELEDFNKPPFNKL